MQTLIVQFALFVWGEKTQKRINTKRLSGRCRNAVFYSSLIRFERK